MPITDEVREKIDEAADKHGFRVPYDGSNSFYDDTAVKSFQAGGEYAYSLALAELLTKGESNSPWIKASERLPTDVGEYFVIENPAEDKTKQWRAAATFNGKIFWEAEFQKEFDLATAIWLDEEKLSRMVAELEAKDKEIERLKGLMQGQAYSIWKGCGSELSFDEWNKKFQHNL